MIRYLAHLAIVMMFACSIQTPSTQRAVVLDADPSPRLPASLWYPHPEQPFPEWSNYWEMMDPTPGAAVINLGPTWPNVQSKTVSLGDWPAGWTKASAASVIVRCKQHWDDPDSGPPIGLELALHNEQGDVQLIPTVSALPGSEWVELPFLVPVAVDWSVAEVRLTANWQGITSGTLYIDWIKAE